MRISLALALLGLLGNVVPAIAAGPSLPKYSLTSTTRIGFGLKTDEVYILDIFDVDGDGATDFAVSADTTGASYTGGVPHPGPPVHSFVVRNDAKSGKLAAFDLGPDGLTNRTWAGLFYKDPRDGKVFLIEGRNGEQGLPEQNHGEATSVFEITPDGTSFDTKGVFVSKLPATTTSVAACDFDGDGTEEIYVNNYNGPDAGPSAPHLLRRASDGT